MKNFAAFVLAILLPCLAAAQCLSGKRFENTYTYSVTNGAKSVSCHAVRVNNNQFLTSAHCFHGLCEAGCDINLDLLSTNPGARVTVHHDASTRAAISNPGFVFAHESAVRDIAVLNINFAEGKFTFYDREFNLVMTREQFGVALQHSALLKKAWNDAMDYNKRLNILTWDGRSYDMQSTFSIALVEDGITYPVCAINRKSYIDGVDGVLNIPNFSAGQGYSGGGVFDASGRLVGIISGGTSEHLNAAVFDVPNYNFISNHVSGIYKQDGPSVAVLAQ